MRNAVFADARAFLGKMLTDNAINYPQDRSAREWTFNYYMNNARGGLLDLARHWAQIEKALSRPEKVRKRTTAPQRRWNLHQTAFEFALSCLRGDLERG